MWVTILYIPIYLRSEENYYREWRIYENREIEKIDSYTGRGPTEERRRLEGNPWLYERLYWWPPWRFNDIVGWVSVNYDGNLWAEMWSLDRKRIVRDPRHRRGSIVWVGKIAETLIGNTQPINSELRQGLLRILDEIGKESSKRRFHLNLEYWGKLIASLDLETLIRGLDHQIDEKPT